MWSGRSPAIVVSTQPPMIGSALGTVVGGLVAGPAGAHSVRIGKVTPRAIRYTLLESKILVGQMERLAQGPQLAVSQVAKGSARDRPKLQRAYSRPNELEDRVANLLKHPPHDPIAPLVDDDPNDRAVLGIADRPDHLRRRPLAVDRDAAPQPIEHRRRRIAVQQRLVLLVDLEARMHDAMGNLAVVGQQQQPLRLAVESANRHDPFADWNEVHDGIAAALV